MTTNNEALANLLATTPGTLATAQHVALKAHVLSVLNQFVRAVETETYGLRELPACADAAELERLRAEVARLTAALKRANDQAEHFEREWYLRGDQIEAALPAMREYARKNPKHHFSADGAEQDPHGAHAWLARNELLNDEAKRRP